MTTLRKPWVGSQYNLQQYKILFVGESHYSKEYFESCKDDENLTIECVEQYCRKEWKNQTWGNLISQFGKLFEVEKGQRREFFEKVSYTNYIQHCMKNASDKPFKYFIHNNDYQSHFYNTINNIQPYIVILFSQRIAELWDYEECGIKKFLEKKQIAYFCVNHLARINESTKLEIQNIINIINNLYNDHLIHNSTKLPLL